MVGANKLKFGNPRGGAPCCLATIIMAEGQYADVLFVNKRVFNNPSEDEIKDILDGKDKENTKKATESALKALHEYLDSKQLPQVDDLSEQELANALFKFYPAIKPIKDTGEPYTVQTLKCMRAGLSHYFRTQKGIDIIEGEKFVKANEIFKGMCVVSKKSGKAVKKSYPPITEIDMECISEYFNYDHMHSPDPKCLQRHLLFYIVYFFCRRGRENLYAMRQDTFALKTKPTGIQYVIQQIDEIDKNHNYEDTNNTNEGRMYGNEGT